MDLVDKVDEQLNEDLKNKADWAYEIVYAQRMAESEQQYLKKIASVLQEGDVPET